MAQDVAQLAIQLEQLDARQARALKTRRGGGPLRAMRPFFFGALLGAGAALLYAPQTGERAAAPQRERIAGKRHPGCPDGEGHG